MSLQQQAPSYKAPNNVGYIPYKCLQCTGSLYRYHPITPWRGVVNPLSLNEAFCDDRCRDRYYFSKLSKRAWKNKEDPPCVTLQDYMRENPDSWRKPC